MPADTPAQQAPAGKGPTAHRPTARFSPPMPADTPAKRAPAGKRLARLPGYADRELTASSRASTTL